MEPETIRVYVNKKKADPVEPCSSNAGMHLITSPALEPVPVAESTALVEIPAVDPPMEGVFVYNSDVTVFKEEIEDLVEDNKTSDNESESDSDDNHLVIEEFKDNEEDNEEDDQDNSQQEDLLVPRKVVERKSENIVKKPRQQKKLPEDEEKYEEFDESKVIKTAFENYFKGLRPDFMKLTETRKNLYKTTLRQIMNEQLDQD